MYPWVRGLGIVARKTQVGEEGFGAVSDGGNGLMRAFWTWVKDQRGGKKTSKEATGQS